MKPSHRHLFCTLTLIALSTPGCGPDHDRQMVYTAPREPMVQVETKNGVRVKAPFVDVRVPPAKPLPPSNGVDVPMIDPD